jgi:hypothetical protein
MVSTMHARQLVELSALVAAHGPLLVGHEASLPPRGIEQYWVASKNRLERWNRTLKQLAVKAAACCSAADRLLVRGVCEEILTGEVLTRVWSAVLVAYDRQRGTDMAEPIARSVLLGHLEARHRVLTLLVSGPGVDAEEAVKLNRLRRRSERWTDLLVGRLAQQFAVSEFAVDPDRARQFAEDLCRQSRREDGRLAWSLIEASLRAAFRQGLAAASPNADLNAAIAASILSCFPAEVFDGSGLFPSAWLVRLTRITSDTQGLIADLLSMDGGTSPDPTVGDKARRCRRRW